MEKIYKGLVLSFLMVICLLGFTEIGSAYCVHNNSSITIKVDGEFCSRCYEGTLHSGDSGCCPGADAGCRGTTMIYVYYDYVYMEYTRYLYCPCEVTAHGDVYITGPDLDHLYVHVYDDNGNQLCAGQMICCYDVI